MKKAQLVSSFVNHRVTLGGVDYIVSEEWTEIEASSEVRVTVEDTGASVDDLTRDKVLEVFEEVA